MKRNSPPIRYSFHVIKKDGKYKVKATMLANIEGSLFCGSTRQSAERHISLLIQKEISNA